MIENVMMRVMKPQGKSLPTKTVCEKMIRQKRKLKM